MKKNVPAIDQLKAMLLDLPRRSDKHAPGTAIYGRWRNQAKRIAKALFSGSGKNSVSMLPIGELVFPYRVMGAVSSLNLFEIDELILFSFYWHNRQLYKNVADIGANIGLHSIMLSKCGYVVKAYEPDPKHCQVLTENLKLNRIRTVTVIGAAVSDTARRSAEFVRVLGNTTSNFLVGSKQNAYGALETIKVSTVSIRSIMKWADLIKLDAEGHEKAILLATKHADWKGTDMLLEIGGLDNAKQIFKHLRQEKVNIFTQKNNWRRAKRISDIPTSYHEGLAFVSLREAMPWGEAV